MVWTKSYDRVRDVNGSVIANVRVIIDYNGTNNRTAALLEVKDYQTTGVNITIDPSDNTATTWEEGVDFTAETSNAITAEKIATEIDGTTNFTANADTGHSGNPWVSIVYTAGGYLSSISTTDTAVYKFYSEGEATTGVPKLAQDDTGTIKYQPLWTDSNGLYSFYIDAPTDIDLDYQKSGYNFDNTYSENTDITVGTSTALSDSDNDTIVKTEETADEDVVRIYASGEEIINFDAT